MPAPAPPRPAGRPWAEAQREDGASWRPRASAHGAAAGRGTQERPPVGGRGLGEKTPCQAGGWQGAGTRTHSGSDQREKLPWEPPDSLREAPRPPENPPGPPGSFPVRIRPSTVRERVGSGAGRIPSRSGAAPGPSAPTLGEPREEVAPAKARLASDFRRWPRGHCW